MTTRINLLDWRAERRERRKQQFISMLGLSLVASAALVGLGWTTMSSAVASQQERNAFLEKQIQETEQKIKEIEELEKVKANLLARMRVIEELQASRSASVHFFDEIVNTLPEGVTLKGIKQAGAQVTLDGVAESNGRVSTYMKNLEASEWFDEPKLIVIKTGTKEGTRGAEFQLQVKRLVSPNQSSDAGESGEVLE
jgi:type IV pilus assembly protein PilN